MVIIKDKVTLVHIGAKSSRAREGSLKNETMLDLSNLCQSDKSVTSFAPSMKIQVYDDHIVCKVVRNLSETLQKLVMFIFFYYT